MSRPSTAPELGVPAIGSTPGRTPTHLADRALGELARAADLYRGDRARGPRGHGLTPANVPMTPVAAIPPLEELNIGHTIVSRAVMFPGCTERYRKCVG
ncbi:MAG: pyridoxine 5'-phosphate synthase [Gemmatimonadales bacterium]